MQVVKSEHIDRRFKQNCKRALVGVPEDLLIDPVMDAYQLRLYLFLYSRVGLEDDHSVTASYSIISQQTGMSVLKAKNVVKELVAKGYLSVVRKKPSSGGQPVNSYTLLYWGV